MIYEIHSFDFDGSLASIAYLSSEEKDIIRSNRELLVRIKLSPHPKIVFVGSNRQGLPDDYPNSLADKRGSCYPAIKTISHELSAICDEFLLSDLYNDLPDGTSFNQALKYLEKNNKDYKTKKVEKAKAFPNWIHDESKLTVLYAQIHKMSLEHPHDTLQFYFYDDREDILNNLHEYFLKYPEMIPSNVTLNLKQYMGPIDRENKAINPLVIDYASIKGTMPHPDINYRHTVKTMAAITIELMTANQIDLMATKSSKPIISYAAAKKFNFNISAIKCAQYYKPEMIAVYPPEVTSPKKTRFGIFKKSRNTSKSVPAPLASSYSSPESLSIRPFSSPIMGSDCSTTSSSSSSSTFSSAIFSLSSPSSCSSSPSTSLNTPPNKNCSSIVDPIIDFDLSLPTDTHETVDSTGPITQALHFFPAEVNAIRPVRQIGQHRRRLPVDVEDDEDNSVENDSTENNPM